MSNRFAVLDVEETGKKKKAPAPAPVAAAPAPAPVVKAAPAPAPAAAPKAPKTAEGAKKEGAKKEGTQQPRSQGGDGERRGPRPEGGERRPPRAEGERRPPRADGERRPPRPEGERRPPRAEGESHSVRPFVPRTPRVESAGAPEGASEDIAAPTHYNGPRRDHRGGRGGRAGRGDGTRREYDRRGPNSHETEKKGGHGRGNWGKSGDNAETPAEGEAAEAKAEGETSAAEPVVEEAPAKTEEELLAEKQMTLEEYKKSKASAQATLPPPRKANEGSAEDPKWKKAQLVERKEEIYYSATKEEPKDTQVHKKERKLAERIDINPVPLIDDLKHQERSDRRERGDREGFRGGDRGDRGGDRGGRGGHRGGDRGGARGGARGGDRSGPRRDAARVPSLDDTQAFPTLGA